MSKLVPSAVASGYSTRFLRNIALSETAQLINGTSCTDPYAVCPGDPPAPPAPASVYITAPGLPSALSQRALPALRQPHAPFADVPTPAYRQRLPGISSTRKAVCSIANVDYFPSERRALVGSAAGVTPAAGAGLHDLVPQELQGLPTCATRTSTSSTSAARRPYNDPFGHHR